MNQIQKAFERDYPEDGDQFVGSMFDVYEKGYMAATKRSKKGKTGWVNLHDRSGIIETSEVIYPTKKEAENWAGQTCIKTIKIIY